MGFLRGILGGSKTATGVGPSEAFSSFLREKLDVDIPPSELPLGLGDPVDYDGLRRAVLAKLEERGIVSSEDEARKLFEREFRLSQYSPPELVQSIPGGKVDYANDGALKIFLNPYTERTASSAYRFLVVLEEGRHFQRVQEGVPVSKSAAPEEIEIKRELVQLARDAKLGRDFQKLIEGMAGKKNVEAVAEQISRMRV